MSSDCQNSITKKKSFLRRNGIEAEKGEMFILLLKKVNILAFFRFNFILFRKLFFLLIGYIIHIMKFLKVCTHNNRHALLETRLNIHQMKKAEKGVLPCEIIHNLSYSNIPQITNIYLHLVV